MHKRQSGIVLPVTSLPGPYGIGSIGAPARKFIDFLVAGGQKYWQMLPLCPTGFGDSPYQSCCGDAGNPYLIDLDELCNMGLLSSRDIDRPDFINDIDYIDYGKLYATRLDILRTAFNRGKEKLAAELAAFASKNKSWLHDYALYMACKEKYDMRPLKDWQDKGLIAREKTAIAKAEAECSESIVFHKFVQYLFWTQWKSLRLYAKERGILMIGDLPIYVSEDSVEVWSRPELFMLKAPAIPSLVAGVPPDYYSATGQLWGNPLYNWGTHAKNGYKWWIARLKRAQRCFDIVRIDHFRGFYAYWAVKAGAETALSGKWKKGPGIQFVEQIKKALPPGSLIAEDLGEIDGKTREFFSQSGLPGMKVLVYAFDPWQDSEFLPHNFPHDCVAYTSSHDSPPFKGWLTEEAGQQERELCFDYLRLRQDEGYGWGASKAIWGSPARLAMAMLQDILGLGMDSRVNTPSTLGGQNWRWRVREEALNDEVAGKLLHMTKTYKRV
ncbi:MAG: 4-alpha-glucanotransferase [Oscillospiraceae bacterium]|nr:4-alpha-glucanotransferase [Oscillospiraceae bacterium]